MIVISHDDWFLFVVWAHGRRVGARRTFWGALRLARRATEAEAER